ncbi:DUF6328 family protein [Phytomonospora endophytica]|uniref:Uncharacterized protein n=1 Tax=Phytomonospora endophytica TaxID=714109 RepID=A0A841FMN4_9ACTN|nr:DUF6328 family protein [Phytomonospora endophytica]MBB6037275.1 hypothetical protein [Phytomonospora endophytica]
MAESERERWERNFGDLLQELRVVQTGNQILFAFLLTVAFSARFAETTTLQRYVYVGTLIAAALATGLIMAPVSHHRLLFRMGAKPHVVRLASVMATWGMVFVMAALAGALFLAVDIVMGDPWAASITASIVAFNVIVWYIVPLRRRWRERFDESA